MQFSSAQCEKIFLVRKKLLVSGLSIKFTNGKNTGIYCNFSVYFMLQTLSSHPFDLTHSNNYDQDMIACSLLKEK